jgi:hypothetical protein
MQAWLSPEVESRGHYGRLLSNLWDVHQSMPVRPRSDIARRTRTGLRSSRPNEKGLLVGDAQTFDVAIGPESVGRVVALIDDLADLLIDGKTKPVFESGDRRTTVVKVGGEPIRLRIVEELDRTRHDPTPDERTRLKQDFVYPRVPAWDYRPDGRLRFEIAETIYGGKEIWSDRPDLKLEGVLVRIAQAIRDTATKQRTRRTEMAERARISAAEERERWEQEARKRKRDERHRALVAEARRWQEAGLLREYAAELRHSALPSRKTLDRSGLLAFIEELHEAADHLDPVVERLGSVIDAAMEEEERADSESLEDEAVLPGSELPDASEDDP